MPYINLFSSRPNYHSGCGYLTTPLSISLEYTYTNGNLLFTPKTNW